MPEDVTNFGFEKVPVAEKAKRVAGVFHSVAGKYDLMNDIMSLGSHRLMKRLAVEMVAVRPGERVMDLAGGTGDITALLSPLVGDDGHVVLCDINYSMLALGRDRLVDRGIVGNIDYVQADAERLPFGDRQFDAITIAFGLRNVTDKPAALVSMLRVLKAGGRLMVLEFSRPHNAALRKSYEAFSGLWPHIGKVVTGDSDSYKYLVESIQVHPDQEELKSMMHDAGFADCRYHDLAGGIAAIHMGVRE
jgi:demethylmenaquinone methyltransferase/2-methoxy-6-polyprenyl-1,4-benzoquinol methylase